MPEPRLPAAVQGVGAERYRRVGVGDLSVAVTLGLPHDRAQQMCSRPGEASAAWFRPAVAELDLQMNDLVLTDAAFTDTGGAVSTDLQLWPGVDDPAALLASIADWLTGYGSYQTRRTYAEGLGLPVTATDIQQWNRIHIDTDAGSWAEALPAYAHALSIEVSSLTAAAVDAPRTAAPPPAPRGRLRHLHWFRWCAGQLLDPACATSAHVKTWLDALAAAGAAPATRDRMLATVKTLYAYLADLGLVAANPAALNRRRLGLATATSSTSSTVTLTTRQVRALYAAAGAPRRGASPLDTARAAAIVALFTLGLRVSELCGLNHPDLHVTRGRRALRVRGKGGKVRIVYLSAPAETALTDYLKALQLADRTPPASVPPPRVTASRTGRAAAVHPQRPAFPAPSDLAIAATCRSNWRPRPGRHRRCHAPARAPPLLRHHGRRGRCATGPRPSRRRPQQHRHHPADLRPRRPRPGTQRGGPGRRQLAPTSTPGEHSDDEVTTALGTATR
jgi:hypothetical protein